MVYEVLNMDVFLTQTHRRPLLTPPEPRGAFFMMDRCTLLDFKIFIAIIKLETASKLFYITLIVFVQKKKVIYIYDRLKAIQLWSNFHFWVNYTFNDSAHQDILDNAMLPTLRKQFGKGPFQFQYDCAPVQIARSVKTWLDDF